MTLDLEALLDRLGYVESEDLVRSGDDMAGLPASRRHIWTVARERLGVDAAYFEGRIPLVYFAGLRSPADDEVERAIVVLHQRTWNQSRAQLLVVVLPTEVRVLDGRSAPGGRVEVATARELDDRSLEPFSRHGLLRGRAADVLSRTRSKPIVLQLRADLRRVRVQLISQELPEDVADALLARCLFAQYLDARNLLPPDSVAQRTFIECLHESVTDTYRLFDMLHERFNGDTFVVSEQERRTAQAAHLSLIADFLSGSGGTGQLSLITRYDFSSISAEVLGRVYEEFVARVQRRNAAFYTPGHIVEAALDEAMPAHADLTSARVLDPACGSGLFLARAYERLLDHVEETLERPPSGAQMAEILANQIFACDVMDDALRVAALSCYLVLLDRLPDGDTNAHWQFPQLVGGNFRQGDFFDLLGHFPGPYEIIASNPPWKKATEPAARYLAERNLPGGSKLTSAQAFFWAGTSRLATNGRMAMLMPARSLYNQRPSERAFQTQALERTALDVVLDLSAFRHELFADAIAPCALYVVRGDAFDAHDYLTFSAPKPGPVSAATGRITVDADRITHVLRRQLRRRPQLLRHLIFGDLRDVEFIDRLRFRYPSFQDITRDGDRWKISVGFRVVGSNRERKDLELLRQIPTITPEDIQPFRVSTRPPIGATSFDRPRDAEIYEGPRVLLARGLDNRGKLRAAYYAEKASYSESILGMLAPSRTEVDALAVCAFLNSRLARYILFMTASSWGIERPELKRQDVAALPIAFLNGEGDTAQLAELARSAVDDASGPVMDQIERILSRRYGITKDEEALIVDRLDVQLPAYYDRFTEAAYGTPGDRELDTYRRILERSLNETLGTKTTVGTAVQGNDIVASIALDDRPVEPRSASDVADILSVPSGTLLIRRPQRTYGRHWVELRKPVENKQVTAAAALHDSDEIVSELLRAAARRERSVSGA
jgi:methylase of polypeptide subunit release factors